MNWRRASIFGIFLVIVIHFNERIRQTEILVLVSMIRSEQTSSILFGGTPLMFELGWKHPCFLITDGSIINAHKILKSLSSTTISNPNAAISSPDRHQRFLGVLAVAELNLHSATVKQAIPALRLALKDKDPDLRNLAIIALTKANAITIPELQDSLHDSHTRITAARAAVQLGLPAKPLAPELLKMALHETVCPYITIESVYKEIGIEPELAVAVFRQQLKSKQVDEFNPSYHPHLANIEAIKRLSEMGKSARSALPDLEVIANQSNNSEEESQIIQAVTRAIQCIKDRCPPPEPP